ncbi:TIGR04141 family sporadically distributed protein [Kribbella sp. NBC_00709]|uniref:TIGR04141 family sporadically distributed protein n=1 Tax=Kribbella sp. NBC_00709 TaxID=2975972 RepID=UPI002E2E4DFF|nr:TIGR04141 family sporadically distributed protein [Kribbella sp. NBC_00709]
MAEKVVRTRQVTLHRLWRTPTSADELFDVLDHEQLDELEDLDFGPVAVADCSGLWVQGSFRTKAGESAEWCAAASRTLGHTVHFADTHSAGLLQLIVDDAAYAIAYGQGYRLLPSEAKDHRFGLEFAIRALDPTHVHKLMRRRPGARGRTEVTLMPNGSAIWAFDVADAYADLVGRASGKSQTIQLSRSRPTQATSVDGGVGLQIRLATDPVELVSDIRTITGVLNRERRPELEFIDRITPVRDTDLVDQLDDDIENLLTDTPENISHRLSAVVPMDLAEGIEDIRAFKVRLGKSNRTSLEVTLDRLLNQARIVRERPRLQAFRDGRVYAFKDEACTHPVGSSKAVQWLEATAVLPKDRHFAMVDGRWYEIDAEYRNRLRQRVHQLLETRSALALRAWRPGETERDYNENSALDPDFNFICLDRRGVKDEFHNKWGFEACDLLGPDNELIHVKQATSSSPLSHLFSQACVAVQGLEGSAQARTRFRELVRQQGRGRELPHDFVPTKVVFGILLKKGEAVTPSTLFPFAQVALIQAARMLQSARVPIDIEVRGIKLASAAT